MYISMFKVCMCVCVCTLYRCRGSKHWYRDGQLILDRRCLLQKENAMLKSGELHESISWGEGERTKILAQPVTNLPHKESDLVHMYLDHHDTWTHFTINC